MSDDTRPDIASIRHRIDTETAYDAWGLDSDEILALCDELERVRTEHAELRDLLDEYLGTDWRTVEASDVADALTDWLAAHPQDPKENP